MNEEILNFIVEKTHDLMNATSCSQEAKEAGQKWLDAIGTENEKEETKRYLQELKEDIIPIDQLIAFTGSEKGKHVFGEEIAQRFHEHGKEIKAKGALYCDCEACKAALAIVETLEKY